MEFTLVVRVHGDSDLICIEVFGCPSPEFAKAVHIVRYSLDFNAICYRDRPTLLGHIPREGMQSPLMLKVVPLVQLVCQVDKEFFEVPTHHMAYRFVSPRHGHHGVRATSKLVLYV